MPQKATAKKTPTPQLGFFASIPAAIYSPEFYAAIPQQSFWKGFWYMARLLVITLVVSMLITVTSIWKNKEQIQEDITKVIHSFPEELVLTLQEGKLSTNVEEPYFIKMEEVLPESWTPNMTQEERETLNLLVIDTKTPFSKDQFDEYETAIWLTEDAIYTIENRGSIQMNVLSEFPDGVLNKALIEEWIVKIKNEMFQSKALTYIIVPIIIIIPFIVVGVFLFTIVGYMLYLLVLALIILLMGYLLKIPLDYGASYKIGFYGVTTSILLSLGFQIVGLNLSLLPFILITLVMVAINLQASKTQLPNTLQ